MKSYTNKLALCSVAAFGLTMLAACGDENTTVVTERLGMDILDKGGKMPGCTNDNAGDFLYVVDSLAVYYCADGEWKTLNGKDGEKGDKGETGAEGKAANGTGCSAEKKEDGIAVSCNGKLVGTLTNGTGSDGKSAYEIAKANGYKGTETEWLASLKGESCSAKKNEDGSIDVSCDGKLVGTLENGKSAYELAKENNEKVGSLTEWLASLKGENCAIATAKDKEDKSKVVGYKITCGENEKIVYNGTDGAGCEIDERKGDGIVKVTCGEGDDKKVVNLYKAMCGIESYDPETHICYEGALYDLGSSVYDDTKEVLTDFRDLQLYKTVTIEGSYTFFNNQTQKNETAQYKETWMAENLNYNTNTETEANSWCGGGESETTNEGDCSVYGRLYTWDAALNACPTGWHLPSMAEWKTLLSVVGASFAGTGEFAYFWSYSLFRDNGIYVAMTNDGKSADLKSDNKDNGHSVRCIKDSPTAPPPTDGESAREPLKCLYKTSLEKICFIAPKTTSEDDFSFFCGVNNGTFVIDCPAGRILECVGPKTGNTIYYYDDPASQMGCDLMMSQND